MTSACSNRLATPSGLGTCSQEESDTDAADEALLKALASSLTLDIIKQIYNLEVRNTPHLYTDTEMYAALRVARPVAACEADEAVRARSVSTNGTSAPCIVRRR